MDQQIQQLHSMVTELQAELQRQRDEITLLRTTSTSSANSRPKPVLPDPERFNGQSYKFDTWLPSIKAKLRVDGKALGDSVAQFYYVYLNLDSQVQAMVLPQLSQAEDSGVWDYISILSQLARVYDNPNKIQEAEDKLFALRQGSDSVLVYIAKFERVLYEARGQDWSDINKIASFRQGLSPTLRSRLAQQLSLPRTYSEFIRVVQQLSPRSSAPAPALPNSQTHGHGHSGGRGEPMDIGMIGSINAIDSIQLSSVNSSSPSATQAISTSTAQRDRFRKEGRCVRCGAQDHWVQKCPLQPHKPDSGRVIITAINDDDDASSCSSHNSMSSARRARLEYIKNM
jgi:hypothetical protein